MHASAVLHVYTGLQCPNSHRVRTQNGNFRMRLLLTIYSGAVRKPRTTILIAGGNFNRSDSQSRSVRKVLDMNAYVSDIPPKNQSSYNFKLPRHNGIAMKIGIIIRSRWKTDHYAQNMEDERLDTYRTAKGCSGPGYSFDRRNAFFKRQWRHVNTTICIDGKNRTVDRRVEFSKVFITPRRYFIEINRSSTFRIKFRYQTRVGEKNLKLAIHARTALVLNMFSMHSLG